MTLGKFLGVATYILLGATPKVLSPESVLCSADVSSATALAVTPLLRNLAGELHLAAHPRRAACVARQQVDVFSVCVRLIVPLSDPDTLKKPLMLAYPH